MSKVSTQASSSIPSRTIRHQRNGPRHALNRTILFKGLRRQPRMFQPKQGFPMQRSINLLPYQASQQKTAISQGVRRATQGMSTFSTQYSRQVQHFHRHSHTSTTKRYQRRLQTSTNLRQPQARTNNQRCTPTRQYKTTLRNLK